MWGDEHEVTAVEYKSEIAAIYHKLYPRDTVIVTDAHEFLKEHYYEYDFIWSSPPCQSHSKARFFASSSDKEFYRKRQPPVYPDMKLWQEIIFLKHYARTKLWIVENVNGFYEPLITPTLLGSHYFWMNFYVPAFVSAESRKHEGTISELQDRKGVDLSEFKVSDKRLLLRNCVEPELGAHIMKFALNPYEINHLLPFNL